MKHITRPHRARHLIDDGPYAVDEYEIGRRIPPQRVYDVVRLADNHRVRVNLLTLGDAERAARALNTAMKRSRK